MTDQLGFQLYSAREFPPLADRIAELKALGYGFVEPYGALLAGQADELKSALRSSGLPAPTSHVALDSLRSDLDAAARSLKELGVKVAIVPFMAAPNRPGDAEGWRRLARELEGIREKLQAHGLELAWHNHDFEMVALPDGSRPMELLLDNAPGLLWEADIAWIVRGGEDPVVWLERYGDRIVAAHVKDIGGAPTDPEDGWADVGHGRLDWAAIVPALRATKARYWVVEHDKPSDASRFARRSIETFRQWQGR
jgi:sugar phosphate isomerase/epimerase